MSARRSSLVAVALALGLFYGGGTPASHAAVAPPTSTPSAKPTVSADGRAELTAVQEELARGIAKLRLPDAPAPYRAEARWVRAQLLSLDGSYGGVITNVMQAQSAGVAEVRVGTPQRDDTNFLGSDAGITRFDVPREPSPRFLRKQIWLALDRAFRGATLAFSQKQVALEQLSTETTVADLGPAAPAGEHVTLATAAPIDRDGLAAMVGSLSARFEDWPSIDNGDVHLQILESHESVLSSEGLVVTRTRARAVLAVVADTQADDGMHLDHGLAIHLTGIPAADDALLAQGEQLVDRVLRELDELQRAPMIDEEYDGPILLLGPAAAQLLASTVATEASGQPAPLSDGGRLMELEPDWQSKVGKTVLPPFLDLIDDPTRPDGFGSYAVDVEGFVPGPLTLVEAGVLRDLMLTRVPNPHHGSGSNGRARMTPALEIGPTLSNLQLRSRKRGQNPAALERELLQRAREDGYDFAYVIESLRDGTVLGPVMRPGAAAYAGTGKLTLPLPARVYRIDGSGKRTLVRGAVIAPVSMRALRRIRAVGQADHVERLRLPVGAFGGFSAEVGMDGILSQTVDVSITTPDLLIDGLELLVERGEHERLPTLSHPLRRSTVAVEVEDADEPDANE
ncbi:metallopeptidase TldD-related protein [Paraliomyxa miuraensis]|uniref:metallopeptidase TldD-related protein n=1 Tax=Paraliomyxa miuraensis TaxID=376150 RepID=UPI00225C22EA|nr:metallopeptidase TldD-related protein [Paraliomyxa miuraensis]MCX4247599.1 metallopeptidase TldD-related protein [Paraliomyxa miuraensis]